MREVADRLYTPRNRHNVRWCRTTAVECVNPDCLEIALWAEFLDFGKQPNGSRNVAAPGSRVLFFQLRPTSVAKPQHSSVPGPLVIDYEEACQILGASPKASATLARRCLQGMIRDFCAISKPTLAREIAELKEQVREGTAPRQVSEESVEAIDAVRAVGNIGAHFERDINLIVDVEPEEAQALISLIELLFAEWYVARADRAARLAAVKQVAANKREQKDALERPEAEPE